MPIPSGGSTSSVNPMSYVNTSGVTANVGMMYVNSAGVTGGNINYVPPNDANALNAPNPADVAVDPYQVAMDDLTGTCVGNVVSPETSNASATAAGGEGANSAGTVAASAQGQDANNQASAAKGGGADGTAITKEDAEKVSTLGGTMGIVDATLENAPTDMKVIGAEAAGKTLGVAGFVLQTGASLYDTIISYQDYEHGKIGSGEFYGNIAKAGANVTVGVVAISNPEVGAVYFIGEQSVEPGQAIVQRGKETIAWYIDSYFANFGWSY